MKKYLVVIGSFIFLILLGALIAYRIALPEIKNYSYYAHVVSEQNSNQSYTLTMNSYGSINLIVQDSKNSYEITQKQYEFLLDNQDFKKVKKILKYFNKNYKLATKKDYVVYFDYDKESAKLGLKDKDALVALMEALEEIAQNSDSETKSESTSLDKVMEMLF